MQDLVLGKNLLLRRLSFEIALLSRQSLKEKIIFHMTFRRLRHMHHLLVIFDPFRKTGDFHF